MPPIHDPDTCPCTYPCNRNKDCEACQRYHHANGSQTACERLMADSDSDDEA